MGVFDEGCNTTTTVMKMKMKMKGEDVVFVYVCDWALHAVTEEEDGNGMHTKMRDSVGHED